MWKEENNALVAEFIFKNFVAAFDFMTEVAQLAEQQGHHPEWSNIYNKVHIKLTTHDAGSIVTEKDHLLARSISSVYQNQI